MQFVTVSIDGRECCVPEINVGDEVIVRPQICNDFRLKNLLKIKHGNFKVKDIDYNKHEVYVEGYGKAININDLVDICKRDIKK